MKTARSSLALLVAVLGGAACATADPVDPADETLAFESLLAGPHSGLVDRRREVIRDEAGFARLWAAIHAGTVPAPSRPAVDFARDMLIAVASGSRPSGGFAIKVESVTARGDALEVGVLETCPPPGAMVSMGLTQPVEVVRLPRLTGAAKFRETRSPSCR